MCPLHLLFPDCRSWTLSGMCFKKERDQQEWGHITKSHVWWCSICLWHTVLFSVLLLCLVIRASFLEEGAINLCNEKMRARRTKKFSRDEFTYRISIFWLSIEVTEVMFRNYLKEADQITTQLRCLNLRGHGPTKTIQRVLTPREIS